VVKDEMNQNLSHKHAKKIITTLTTILFLTTLLPTTHRRGFSFPLLITTYLIQILQMAIYTGSMQAILISTILLPMR